MWVYLVIFDENSYLERIKCIADQKPIKLI